jgi:hypothetical protein
LNVNLTRTERRTLHEFHGNSREAREVILKLHASGHRWCSACDAVKPLDEFGRLNKPGPRFGEFAARCNDCHRGNRVARRPSYAPLMPDYNIRQKWNREQRRARGNANPVRLSTPTE